MVVEGMRGDEKEGTKQTDERLSNLADRQKIGCGVSRKESKAKKKRRLEYVERQAPSRLPSTHEWTAYSTLTDSFIYGE